MKKNNKSYSFCKNCNTKLNRISINPYCKDCQIEKFNIKRINQIKINTFINN